MILPKPGRSHTDRPERLNCTFSENWFKFVLSYQRLVWCCQAVLCIYHQRNNRYQQELEWKAVDWGGERSSKKFFFLLLFFFLTNARTQGMNQSLWSLDVPEQTVRATFVLCWYFVNSNKRIRGRIQTMWAINLQWSWWTPIGRPDGHLLRPLK